MKQTNNELLRAVRFALYAGTAATVGLTAAPAFAQAPAGDQGSEKLETIVVTGSRIRRVDLETASPVFVVDKATIEKTGKLTVGDLLQETPSIAGAATNPQVNNGGGAGASTVSLRGLGSQRTLLLLNGRRMAFNDVNSIPINMIERIEILKDGASAIYGSDAIGGVVNFITRTDYQGMEASVDYGVSDRDDGERKGVQISMGQTSDRGSLVVGASWHKIDQVNARDRKYAEAALYNYFGSVFPLGSPTGPQGRYVIPKTVSSTFGIDSCPGQAGANVQLTRKTGAAGTSVNDFRCYVPTGPGNDTFNFQAVGNTVQTPQERGGLFAIGSYKITDGIEAYVEAFTHKTKSNQEIAPNPLSFGANSGVILSKDSVYNPFGVNVSSGSLRFNAIGNRATYFRTRFDQLNAGLRGNIGDTSWHWDAGFSFGRVSQFTRTTGHFFNAALRQAVGPSYYDADGIARCGTAAAPIANCTPVNLFGLDASTAQGQVFLAALRTLQADTESNFYGTTKSQEINVSGELFDLPAGAVSLAAGVQHSKDTSNFVPNFVALITNPDTGGCLTDNDSCQSPSSGTLSHKDVYFELLVPVLRDTFLAKSLNVTLGSRYSDYSAFGNTTNSKIGIEWRPIDDLLVRGTVAEVFRAPTISDLFSGVTNSADTYNDPCGGLTAGNSGNPACVGVPVGFVQTTAQTNTLNGSNPNVQPEQGKVFTWGLVYDPNWLEGVSTSLDVWKVSLHDTIGTLGTQVILDQCFNFGRFCNLFTRNAETSDVEFVTNTTQNVGRLDTQGFDFSIKYRLPETSWGNFRVSFDGTYLQKWNKQVIEGDVTTQVNMAGAFIDSSKGGDGSYARWRGLGNIGWNMGAFDASWRMRYINGLRYGRTYTTGGGYGVVSPDFIPKDQIAGGHAGYKIGAYTYHDVQFGYNMEALNTRVEVGIDNINDKQPPLFYQYGFNANTDVRTYDTVGRYYWARLGVKF